MWHLLFVNQTTLKMNKYRPMELLKKQFGEKYDDDKLSKDGFVLPPRRIVRSCAEDVELPKT